MERRKFFSNAALLIGSGAIVGESVPNKLWTAERITPDLDSKMHEPSKHALAHPDLLIPKKGEMLVQTPQHFHDLLSEGKEDFRIALVVTWEGRKVVISESAPFDREDPMSYVLVKLIFNEIAIFVKP